MKVVIKITSLNIKSNHSVVNLLKKASTVEDEKSSIKLNIQEQYIKFKRVAKENSFQVVGNFVLEMWTIPTLVREWISYNTSENKYLCWYKTFWNKWKANNEMYASNWQYHIICEDMWSSVVLIILLVSNLRLTL